MLPELGPFFHDRHKIILREISHTEHRHTLMLENGNLKITLAQGEKVQKINLNFEYFQIGQNCNFYFFILTEIVDKILEV